MTMPHLMNCMHSCDGWCLDCVKELYEECERANEKLHQTQEEISAQSHIQELLPSTLFTIEEDGDCRSSGTRGVGVTWNIWRSIKVIVSAYMREHCEQHGKAGE